MSDDAPPSPKRDIIMTDKPSDVEVEAAIEPIKNLLRIAGRDGVLVAAQRVTEFTQYALTAAAAVRPTAREELAGLKCRFGCDHPVGIYSTPEGCVCWPDPVQALCAQHANEIESTGPVTLIIGRGLADFSRTECGPTAGEARAQAIEECAKVAKDWLAVFADRGPTYVSAQKWATDAVQDIIDGIRALNPAPPPISTPGEEWQPIETAPRDGPAILAIFENFEAKLILVCIRWIEDMWVAGRCEGGKISCIVRSPTHWRPLPAPPQPVLSSPDREGEGEG